jgi:hypothetical protein
VAVVEVEGTVLAGGMVVVDDTVVVAAAVVEVGGDVVAELFLLERAACDVTDESPQPANTTSNPIPIRTNHAMLRERGETRALGAGVSRHEVSGSRSMYEDYRPASDYLESTTVRLLRAGDLQGLPHSSAKVEEDRLSVEGDGLLHVEGEAVGVFAPDRPAQVACHRSAWEDLGEDLDLTWDHAAGVFAGVRNCKRADRAQRS